MKQLSITFMLTLAIAVVCGLTGRYINSPVAVAKPAPTLLSQADSTEDSPSTNRPRQRLTQNQR